MNQLLFSLRHISLIILVTLITFFLTDYLAIVWFIQWDGAPISYPLNVILFIIIVLLRTFTAEFTLLKLFREPFKIKKKIILSLVIFGPPLMIIQLITGFHIIIDFVSFLIQLIILEATLLVAIISFLMLFLLSEFSRIMILYWLKKHLNS